MVAPSWHPDFTPPESGPLADARPFSSAPAPTSWRPPQRIRSAAELEERLRRRLRRKRTLQFSEADLLTAAFQTAAQPPRLEVYQYKWVQWDTVN